LVERGRAVLRNPTAATRSAIIRHLFLCVRRETLLRSRSSPDWVDSCPSLERARTARVRRFPDLLSYPGTGKFDPQPPLGLPAGTTLPVP
jgi:hypothetical protein